MKTKTVKVFPKLKDFKPKYKMLEVLIPSEKFIKLMSEEEAKAMFGEYEVLSVKDYRETESTSVIIKKWRTK